MLRFTYEGQTYKTDSYKLSSCQEFWLVPAELISVTLASVMDELIIPFDDAEASDLERQEELAEMRELNEYLEENFNMGFEEPEELRNVMDSSEETIQQSRRIRNYYDL